MSTIVGEANPTRSGGIIRFMLYTDVSRRRATRIGNDIEADFNLVLGDAYSYETQHELIFDEISSEPGQYIVAMLPYLKRVPHPERKDLYVPLRVIYLTTVTLWPFFEPIADEALTMSMLPE